jgi:hypothetical protein
VLNSSGAARNKAQLKTEEGILNLEINQGTILQTSDGKVLKNISATTLEPSHETPADALLITGYNLGPEGARFNPSLSLVMGYDPASLPEGTTENDLYLAYREGDRWVKLLSQLNSEEKTVSAGIEHFSQYALLAKLPPPPPAEFVLSPLSVTPPEVTTGNPVTIRTEVSNTGGSGGLYMVTLTINGIEEGKRVVMVEAGETETVTFEVTQSQAGEYNYEINGMAARFSVKEGAGEPVTVPGPEIQPVPVTERVPLPLAEPAAENLKPGKKADVLLLWLIVGIAVFFGMYAIVRRAQRKEKGG